MTFIRLLLFCLLLKLCFAGKNGLSVTTGCVCSGQNVSYECSVVSGHFTVWSGSIMANDCEIALPHAQFLSSTEHCNNGAVSGRGIKEDGNQYTSQLTVLAAQELEGGTIECSADYVSNVTLIGSLSLTFRRAPLAPPTDVQLVDVKPGELTFDWVPPTNNCSSLTYLVEAQNCGICQNRSSLTNSTCSNFTMPQMCTFKVYSCICDSILSNDPSNTVNVNLAVPYVPIIIDVLPYYSDISNNLQKLMTRFHTVKAFNISADIDGSATTYTIFYFDQNTRSICYSTNIPTVRCELGVCSHVLEVSSSNCHLSADIILSVFATNALGNGQSSENISIDGTNQLVNVNFLPGERSIICQFLDWQHGRITRTCSVNITYGRDCEKSLGFYSATGPTVTVQTPSINLLSSVAEYCFNVTARSGNKTLIVEGVLNLISYSADVGAIIASVIPVAAILTIISIVTICVVRKIYRNKYKPTKPVTLRFSNKDEKGALAKVLEVFKAHNINILRINAPWHKSDLNRTGSVEIYLHFPCTLMQKAELQQHFGEHSIEFLRRGYPKENMETGVSSAEPPLAHVVLNVDDRPGCLWQALKVFEEKQINLHGLNTVCISETHSGLINNYVSFVCSANKLQKVVSDLKETDAENVTTEFIDSAARKLHFLVEHQVGALVKALKIFAQLNISISWINSMTHSPGEEFKKQHVECICNQNERARLLEKLTSLGAIGVEERQISVDQTCPDYCVIDFAVRDEVGSLVTVLQGFQECNINITGVNTYNMNQQPVSPGVKYVVEYVRLQLEFQSLQPEYEEYLVKDLKATGFILNVTSEVQSTSGRTQIQFSLRNEVETLIEALNVFAKYDVNITDLHREPYSVRRDVEYMRNFVVFHSTEEDYKHLKHKLQATHLADDLRTFDLDEQNCPRLPRCHIETGCARSQPQRC